MMLVIGVDVGSGSVRAVVTRFVDNRKGRVVSTCSKAIPVYNPVPDYYEQRTSEIWEAVVFCVQECTSSVDMNSESISSIAFTATCSLVIVEPNSKQNDVIMWMDHRAVEEAQLITSSKHVVLHQFGGSCSPEFSLAKLLWLKRNQPERFRAASAFMELPDWLSWQCIKSAEHTLNQFQRSSCSVTCKWGFDAELHEWPQNFFEAIGLQELLCDESRIGKRITAPGKLIGWLSDEAASQLGLKSNGNSSPSDGKVSVASPIIDAHSGVLAMLTLYANHLGDGSDLASLFCVIAGTSTCHMVSTLEKKCTKGVWGPYFNAILPNYYVREAGQSATGKLIERVIRGHSDWERIYEKQGMEMAIKTLNERIKERRGVSFGKNSIHVNPAFHGNRSPLAEPALKGAIYGLTLKETELIDLYEATLEALAYDTKFIIEELKMSGMKALLVSGGLQKNEVYMQIHSDVLNTQVIGIKCGQIDMMLVGAAIMGRQAAAQSDLNHQNMADISFEEFEMTHFAPNLKSAGYHQVKYQCYRELLSSAQRIEAILRDQQ